ncbi:hypothetical protein HYS79_02635 [Patescibacteria group bacterium]|nr:hypothetical protein [Patescibacteria group bacterium]
MSYKYELFVIDRKSELDGEEQKRVTYLRDKLSTAESLGLEAQSASIKADIATVERGRLITTSPMTDTELTIWRAWLPTAYTDIGDDKRHQLANYHFDRIPQPVLKMWQKHKESGAFERFEIWTPENPRPDPILVGVNGTARHLLARWGESDANLISFDDVKRELMRRWDENEYETGEYWDLPFVPIFPAILIGSVPLFVFASFGIKGFVPPILALLIAIIAYFSVRHVMTRMTTRGTKERRDSSTLMQAIAKDDSVQRELYPASA